MGCYNGSIDGTVTAAFQPSTYSTALTQIEGPFSRAAIGLFVLTGGVVPGWSDPGRFSEGGIGAGGNVGGRFSERLVQGKCWWKAQRKSGSSGSVGGRFSERVVQAGMLMEGFKRECWWKV